MTTALKSISANLSSILPNCKIRHALDLYLNSAEWLFLSRGKVSRVVDSVLRNYNNSIKTISEFNYSIDAPIDRIIITCQNVDSNLGFYLASDLRKLDYAIGKYSRQYEHIITGLIEDDVDKFYCVLANAEANEKTIQFELVVDIDALGNILASRSLSPKCPWTYQNGIECTSTSELISCSKTIEACILRHADVDPEEDRSVEHGGFEFFQNFIPTPPGSPGNEYPIHRPCFPAGTLIWCDQGFKNIEHIEKEDSVYSWNKVTKQVALKKVYATFCHTNTPSYFTIKSKNTGIQPTPEHEIGTDRGLIAADSISVKSTKLSVFNIEHVNKLDQKNGWLLDPVTNIKHESDKNCDTYNFSVEDFATYFIADKVNTKYVTAVSNSKYNPDSPNYF